MKKRSFLLVVLALLLLFNVRFITAEEVNSSERYDIVIKNGRVMDPETELDEVGLNIGIKDKKILSITADPLEGDRVIDATGLVVAPGFIDPLSYDPNPVGNYYKLADGITTVLVLHGGTVNPSRYYAYYEKEGQAINYGVSYFVAEMRVGLGISPYQHATEEQIEKMVEKGEKALNEGAMAVSFSLEYYPGTGADEIIPLMELAARYNVPVFFHVRYSTMYGDGGNNLDALNEVVNYARETGAAIHIDHINSTGGTFSMEESLNILREAREEGLKVTACTYPYNYWATRLSSARFDSGWQERFQISYEDLQLIGHEERMNKESFYENRAKYGVLAAAYAIPEEDVVRSIEEDFVMIGSDGMIEPDPDGGPPGMNNHPRGAGNCSRLIAKYVREQQVISLMDAIRKMTLLPAQLLEEQVPALRKKGRIQEGMDADLVIFDFENIKDCANVVNPAQYSEGIPYVLVNGKVVIDEEGIHRDVRAGRPLKSEFSAQGNN
ncbi:MAG: amidohydrolase family protein [Halanaerobiales bacterium]